MILKRMLMSNFYCTKCGKQGLSVWRTKGSGREAGHLKALYCPYCNETINHVECDAKSNYTYKDFMIEFTHHNFTPEGTRVKTYNQLKGEIENAQI